MVGKSDNTLYIGDNIMRYVYMLGCADDSIYTGITTDVDRRLHEHNHDTKGAAYTKGKRPVNLLWSQQSENRSSATKLELQIKKLTRAKKIELIQNKIVYKI